MSHFQAPPLAVDDEGDALIGFYHAAEGEPPADAPLPLALTALWHDERVLMVFDRYRQSWELPGGRIEPGETPREAASRELLEESGQEPDRPLRFIGFAAFVLGPVRRREYGALFAGRTSSPLDFQANDEIAAIHWWGSGHPLREPAHSLDAYLAGLTRNPADPAGRSTG